jgi:chlorophyll synthase
LGLSIISVKDVLINLFIFAITTFCIVSFIFAVNNYYDVTSDRNNPRRKNINAIASGKISKSNAKIFLGGFIIVPLVICSLFTSRNSLILCIWSLFLGWAYSAPPLRLKSRPGVDVIVHFFGFFLLVLFGSVIANSPSFLTWMVALSAGIFSCVFQICNHIMDYEFDKASNTTTFVVWAGPDTAKSALNILVIAHVILLLPLIILYSLHFLETILVVCIGLIVGIAFSKPKIMSHSSKISGILFLFYATIFIWLSCVLYHFLVYWDKIPLLSFQIF